MATEGRERPDHLTHFQRLCQEPGRYHIFLALRILEAHFADAPPFGRSRRPREDRMRLGQEATMAFPDTTLREVTPPTGKEPGRLTNHAFGLFGPHGPLPPHLTEFARERHRSFRDPTFVRFADMLTHRLLGLFYRAWTAGQPAASFDRGEGADAERRLASIAGYNGKELTGRDSMPDLARRYFAGHLAHGSRHPQGLVSLLSAFFRAPVRIREFVGRWLDLDPSDQWQLGGPAGLGQGTSIGSQVWSRQAKFRIQVGPMSLADYQRLMPGGGALRRLTALVRSYVGDALDWDVNLILRAADIPPAILGQDTKLGQTSWIGDPDRSKDADDLFIAPAVGFGATSQ